MDGLGRCDWRGGAGWWRRSGVKYFARRAQLGVIFAAKRGKRIRPTSLRTRRLLPAALWKLRGRFAVVEQMAEGEKRSAQEQARTGIAHHFPHLLAALWLVTVNRTFGAGGLLVSVRALLKALERIVPEVRTRRTELALRSVLVAAVQRDHRLDRLPLALVSRPHCGCAGLLTIAKEIQNEPQRHRGHREAAECSSTVIDPHFSGFFLGVLCASVVGPLRPFRVRVPITHATLDSLRSRKCRTHRGGRRARRVYCLLQEQAKEIRR